MQKSRSVFPKQKMAYFPSSSGDQFRISKELPSRSICGANESQFDRGHGGPRSVNNAGTSASSFSTLTSKEDDAEITELYILNWLKQYGFNSKDLTQTQTFEFRRMTPLLYAASLGKTNICKYFIYNKNVSIHEVNEVGGNAMFYSCGNGHLSTSKFILSCIGGVDIFQQINKFGLTPFSYAIINGHLNIVKWIVEEHLTLKLDHKIHKLKLLFGIDKGIEIDKRVTPALDFACGKGNMIMAAYIYEQSVSIFKMIDDSTSVSMSTMIDVDNDADFIDYSNILWYHCFNHYCKNHLMYKNIQVSNVLLLQTLFNGHLNLGMWLISIGYFTKIDKNMFTLPENRMLFQVCSGVTRVGAKYDEAERTFETNRLKLISLSQEIIKTYHIFMKTFLVGTLPKTASMNASLGSTSNLKLLAGHDGIRRIIAQFVIGYSSSWRLSNIARFVYETPT